MATYWSRPYKQSFMVLMINIIGKYSGHIPRIKSDVMTSRAQNSELRGQFLLFLIDLFLSFAAEIIMLDNCVVVYKFIQDLHFFVTGGDDENELILATVLQGFFDTVGLLLRF